MNKEVRYEIYQSDIPLFQQVANQLEEEIFHEVY